MAFGKHRETGQTLPLYPLILYLLLIGLTAEHIADIDTLCRIVYNSLVNPAVFAYHSRVLTARQKAYRKYLQSDHWKALRSLALDRDGWKCVRCASVRKLQVHHLCYRGTYENTLLSDLETVCRECHRAEHGIGPSMLDAKCAELLRLFNYQKRPSAQQWRDLRALIKTPLDWITFGDVMFQYVFHVWPHSVERPEWWMDKEKSRFWFRRAHAIRNSIHERSI